MGNYAIELTDGESAHVAGIELDKSKVDYEACQKQGPLILQLLESLGKRKAIPEIRNQYWTEPRFHHGRINSSNKGLFEHNGAAGNDIYIHPHFLPFLRYFLFSANLPAPVIEAFEQQVGNPEWVTSGDVQGITKRVRALMREFRLDKGSAREEFYRLSLDMGLDQIYAQVVLRAAKQVR